MKPISKIKDPFYEQQWNLKQMGVNEETWGYSQGEGVVVGLIDSGVDGSHEDLGWDVKLHITGLDAEAVVRRKYKPVMDVIRSEAHPKILPGYNFVEGHDWTWDRYRHGTYLAGIIAAESDGFGMVGVAPLCKIRPYVVLKPDGGWHSATAIVNAINRASQDGCGVINMSLAWMRDYPQIEEVIDAVTDEGCIVVAATGNRNREGLYYPAAYEKTIAVGGSNPQGGRWVHNSWRGSSYGNGIDCIAPGAAQTTTRKMRSRFARIDGTSMACANMTGVVALLKAIDPNITTSRAKRLIEQCGSHWTKKCGCGVPNALKMCKTLSGEETGTAVILDVIDGINDAIISLSGMRDRLERLV